MMSHKTSVALFSNKLLKGFIINTTTKLKHQTGTDSYFQNSLFTAVSGKNLFLSFIFSVIFQSYFPMFVNIMY